MSAILGFTVGGIIIAYVREKNFKHFIIIKDLLNQYDLPNIKAKKIIADSRTLGCTFLR